MSFPKRLSTVIEETISQVVFGRNFPKIKHLIFDGALGYARVSWVKNPYRVKFHKNAKGEIVVSFLGAGDIPLFGFDKINEKTPIYDIQLDNV
jgi:hypothetical protein